MYNNKFKKRFPEYKFKKITVIYADDLKDIPLSLVTLGATKPTYAICSKDFWITRMSDKIRYVKYLCENYLKSEVRLFVITNDYFFIRFLESYAPKDKFCIYNYDSNTVVYNFVSLKPNPTLDMAEELYKFSVTQALKGG